MCNAMKHKESEISRMKQDHLIERLTSLEYAIRQAMTVREDQEELANPEHKIEAEHCGISADVAVTKGELLNAVQTLVRATRKQSQLG